MSKPKYRLGPEVSQKPIKVAEVIRALKDECETLYDSYKESDGVLHDPMPGRRLLVMQEAIRLVSGWL